MNKNNFIEWLKTGSDEAFEEFYNKYYKYAFLTAYAILRDSDDAKDIAQNILIRIWKKRKKLNINGSIKTYINKSAANECWTWIEQHKNKLRREGMYQSTQNNSFLPTPLEENIVKRQLEDIYEALKSIPEHEANSFMRYYKEDLSQKEIAEAAGVSVSSIKKYIHNARKLLKSKLNKK